MYNDVIDLRDFYASPTGRVAQRVVRQYVRAVWPDLRGMNVAGIGYPIPYLRPFVEEAERVAAFMPAQQGVTRWLSENGNAAALVSDGELPLPDVSMDRVLLVHAVECSERLRRLLREVWRVLADGGRVLIVVPNRRGIWARLDHTPFGHGHPYTPRQLSRLLRDNLFVPGRHLAGLFVPPTRSRMLLGAAPAIEKAGARCFRTIAGLLFVEAGKQLYAGAPAGARAVVRAFGPAQPAGRDLSSRQQKNGFLASQIGAALAEVARGSRARKRERAVHLEAELPHISAKSRMVQRWMFGVSNQS